MIDEARALYQVPPKEFVAARNALVKQLKAAGRREDAADVASLKRPRTAEHALNLVAAADPQLIEAYAAAVHEATDAQRRAIEQGEGGALRVAAEGLRAAAAQVVGAATRALDAAGESGDAHRLEVNEILRETLDDTALALLRGAVLGSSAADGGVPILQGDPPARAAPAESTPAGEKVRGGQAAASPVDLVSAADQGDGDTHDAAAAAPAQRRVTAAQRREAARVARERVAQRRVLEQDLRAARTALSAAERDLDRARRAVEEASSLLAESERRAVGAAESVAALEQALDGAG